MVDAGILMKEYNGRSYSKDGERIRIEDQKK
jgi:hypothetical protein